MPTHSIARLIDSLPPDMSRPPVLLESACLTPYATTYRDPVEDDDPDVPEAEYRDAIHLAESVFHWAVQAIRSDSSSSPS